MNYEIELIRKEQLQTNPWSGGSTTELAIYPKNSLYSDRNFIWRLSSARVEVEESNFTYLPDFNRIIMILEGEMTLEHEGHYKKALRPFEKDSFSGGWKTKSLGRVVDFNLMMGEGCEGELEAIHLEKGQTKTVTINDKMNSLKFTQAIYCVNGQIIIKISTEKEIVLDEGNMIMVTSKEALKEIRLSMGNREEREAILISASININQKLIKIQ